MLVFVHAISNMYLRFSMQSGSTYRIISLFQNNGMIVTFDIHI